MFKLAKNIKLTKKFTNLDNSFELNKVMPKFPYKNGLKTTNIYEQTIKSNYSQNIKHIKDKKFVRYYSSNMIKHNKKSSTTYSANIKEQLGSFYIIVARLVLIGSITLLFSLVVCSIILNKTVIDPELSFYLRLALLTMITCFVWPIIPFTTYFYYKHNYAELMWKKYWDIIKQIGSYNEFFKKYGSYEDFKKKQYPLLSKIVVEK